MRLKLLAGALHTGLHCVTENMMWGVQVAGLVGGPGLFPGVNVGEGVAVFEQGARHVAKDIAGQGVANPSAGLLAAAMMLRHLNLPGFSDRQALSHSLLYVQSAQDPGRGTV
jgi:isocitrate/isopropylmalate dehydrogenase